LIHSRDWPTILRGLLIVKNLKFKNANSGKED
jgi:hypothetical protein